MTRVITTSIVINLVLVALFSLQFSSFITNSFEVQRFEERARELSVYNGEVGVKLSNKGQLSKLNELAQELNFERTGEIEFIQAGGVVAQTR